MFEPLFIIDMLLTMAAMVAAGIAGRYAGRLPGRAGDDTSPGRVTRHPTYGSP